MTTLVELYKKFTLSEESLNTLAGTEMSATDSRPPPPPASCSSDAVGAQTCTVAQSGEDSQQQRASSAREGSPALSPLVANLRYGSGVLVVCVSCVRSRVLARGFATTAPPPLICGGARRMVVPYNAMARAVVPPLSLPVPLARFMLLPSTGRSAPQLARLLGSLSSLSWSSRSYPRPRYATTCIHCINTTLPHILRAFCSCSFRPSHSYRPDMLPLAFFAQLPLCPTSCGLSTLARSGSLA